MIIKHITVRHFGSVEFFHAQMCKGLNVLDTYFTSDISAAIEFLSYSKYVSDIQKVRIEQGTSISAEVLLKDKTYFVEVKPSDECVNSLKLTVTDSQGQDATDLYLQSLSHFTEQDATEKFDGQDKSISLRLSWYRNCEDCEHCNAIASGTNHIVHTRTFRQHLMRYIRAFEPESINNRKNYKAYINQQGKFEVKVPDFPSKVCLSETEEKLFRYICFLNIARFWEEIEKIRDIHHEKKPLLIKNFLEFLDYETDIKGLINRTLQLRRQVIMLTLPMEESTKKEWIGDYDE